MSPLARVLRLLVLLTPAAFSLACGGAPDSSASTEEAQVKGRILLAGKPLGKIEVRFNPSNVNRKDAPTATAVTSSDGLYEVTTLVGRNQVSLKGASIAKKPQLAYFTQTIDVKAGTNELDISLPPKP